MDRVFVMIAGGLGFLAVALGAFGSHGLSAHFEANPGLEATFNTANQYHMAHALALIGVAWAVSRWGAPHIVWAGWAMLAGVVIFSGSLYLLSLTGARWLGAVTPVGGVFFLAGWALLIVGAARG